MITELMCKFFIGFGIFISVFVVLISIFIIIGISKMLFDEWRESRYKKNE